MRVVCLLVNALLGALFLSYAVWSPSAGPGRLEEFVFYCMVAVLFGAVAAGFGFHTRWLIVVPAITLFLASLVFALLVGVVGWQWDGSPTAAFAVSILEAFCIVFARRVRAAPRP
jgi:peptidoglycan/LPS O-acetylase OafA/YrhL